MQWGWGAGKPVSLCSVNGILNFYWLFGACGASQSISFFKKICFVDYVITVVLIFPPLPSLCLLPPFPPAILPPPPFMFMGHACKFLGFSISYTILNIPSLFYTYQLCFLFPVPFPPLSPFPFPADNLPNNLHTYDSFPVLVVCLVN